MRTIFLCAFLFPTLAFSDEILLTSKVTDVTLYPQGAKVTRKVPFDVSPGQHVLRLLDLPSGTPMETLRVAVEGAAMGALNMRNDYLPPRPDAERPEVKAARDEVDSLVKAIRAKQDEAQALRLNREAADTRIGFLRQLGEGEALDGTNAEALRSISRMVGEETLAARQEALKAEASARDVDEAIKDLREDLEDARKRLIALVPELETRNLVEVNIESDKGGEGVFSLTYTVFQAGWYPVYDAFLTRGDGPELTLKRGALIGQSTGENWQQVALTLSTNRPSGQSAPTVLYPERRVITDPEPAVSALRKQSAGYLAAEDRLESVVMEAEPFVEAATASVATDGISVTYTYPDLIDLTSDADFARIELGELDFEPEVIATAVPLFDETAFLSARISNDSSEMILPSAETQLFLDGEFVGSTASEHVPSGDDTTLSFGPIDGLRLARIAERNEGDRGVLSKSNEKTEDVVIKLENLTGVDWNVRLLDRVPYSEQEDLEISWTARPVPSDRDVDDQTGILSWEFPISAGETREISLGIRINWPENKVLR